MTQRIDALRHKLDSIGCDALFSVSPPANQYLSGMMTSFEEISSVLVITATEAHFLCDFRYTEQAQREVEGYEIAEVKGDTLARGGELLTKLGVQKAAFDPAGLTVDEHRRLAGAYAGELVSNAAIVSQLRVIKELGEIDTIRAASNLAESVLTDLVPTLAEGLAERDLAAQFEYEFKKRGASGASFDTIALFGPKSSLPHGIPDDTCLKQGDIVLLDFGCRRSGYCSDLTRTFVFGTIPAAWFSEIYDLTYEAQHRALDAVRPGNTGREVDTIARNIITDGGYGEYFGHGLGHGVGVEIHEPPRLNTESETVLEPGMVVTVEPGIYLPGKGGVRIEDLVVVTEDGCDILTKTPKELRVLGQ